MNRVAIALTTILTTGYALADTSLVCPSTSTNTGFSATAFGTDCSSTSDSTQCTSKAGVTYDSTNSVLTLPTTAGNFQSPPAADVNSSVYFAAVGDFDHDGWEDMAGATSTDDIYITRNQTITCGTSGCSGSSSSAPSPQTISNTWWGTLSNVRAARFNQRTTTGGTQSYLKAGLSVPGSLGVTPMIAGDFDGDGWMDFAEISGTYVPSTSGSDLRRWPTAARLFMNTQNCRQATATTNIQSCGIGTLCTGQATNGACSLTSAGTPLVNGSAWPGTAAQDMSCTNTSTCPYYYPTFATYDLRTGAAVTSTGTTTSTPTTSKPGDFGPVGHPGQNMIALDWDGDGDIDILYGHAAGTCPGTLCTVANQVFYSGIDVWLNDCAQSAQWNATTKSCIGHIPQFSHSNSTCTGASCNLSDVLIPSTAHNTSTIAPTTNLGFDVTYKETPVFAYVDIDNDGDLDLVLGSPGCCSSAAANRLRVFKGTSSNKYTHMLDTANPISLSTSSSTYPGFEGGLTAVFAYDFSLDGYPDLVTGSDSFAYNANNGGRARYWQNSGNPSAPFGNSWPTGCSTPNSSCNPEPTRYLSEACTTSGNNSCSPGTTTTHGYTEPTYPDFDMGIFINYDNDPTSTKDFVMTDGNTGNRFYIFPNRASAASVVPCGTVASGTLSTPNNELTVSGACLTPTATVPAGTAINYSLSNDGGQTWQNACLQTSTGIYSTLPATSLTLLNTGICCSLFVTTTNINIEWKAEMDSSVTNADLLGLGVGVGAPNGCNVSGTVAPSISNVVANYTYTTSANHYKAGVITSDGVTYVGSYTQPGNRGHFIAVSADFNTPYWDAGAILDSSSATRNLYTSNAVGLSPTRVAYNVANASALWSLIGALTLGAATPVINWVTGARFGSNGTLTKLGAIVDSTPAIIQKPFKPYWYSYLNAADRGLYDAFITAQSNRIPLVMVGAMDGFIHAFYAISSNISDSRNGTEAWGYVPPYVAAGMTSDYNAACPLGICLTQPTVSSYPDGSPALIDYKKSDGTIATAALMGDGQGGSELTALDVTQTVTPTSASANTVQGPTPMWSIQPGANPGKATSKAGVARVLISNVETFVVVAGTGVNSSDATKGNVVGGYNLQTGALLWQYQMDCALTSDITIFETDDSGETGNPKIDGYADRAVFADACGNVYKINPGQNLSGGWMGNAGYGPIAKTTLNGVQRTALFSTTSTTGAIGGARPIVGTIGARIDNTTDLVLFFGTGGLESFASNVQNEFYAVYAKNGAIRNKVTGACTSGRCQKFYGGVVVSTDTVYMVTSTDAVIGTGTCDYGSSQVLGYNLNTFNNTLNVSSVSGTSLAASAGPLFGDAGALYFATVSGKVERIGSPIATSAGANSSSTLSNMGASDTGGAASAFTLLGWREVL